MRLKTAALLLLLGWMASTANASEVGDRVVVVAPHAVVQEDKGPRSVPLGFVLVVNDTDATRLEVNAGYGPGWIREDHVVPFNQAIDYFDSAIADNPQDPTNYVGRATVYFARHDFDRALADCNKALRLAQGSIPEAHNLRGLCFDRNGEYAKAIDDFSEAIRLDPGDPTYVNNRGTSYQAGGDLARALEDYNRAMSIDPQYATALNNRGNLLAQKGMHAEALVDLRKAVAIEPDNPNSNSNLGSVLYRINELREACKYLTRAIEIDLGMTPVDPRLACTYTTRGLVQAHLGDLERAMADHDAAIELEPSYSVAYSNRALVWAEKGDMARAIQDCDRAIELDGNNYCGYVTRARCRPDQPALAIADFAKAIELDDSNASVRADRAFLYIALGRLEEARKDAERALALDENCAGAHAFRGVTYFRTDVNLAMAELRKAKQLDPEHALARFYLACALMVTGHQEEARREMEEAIRLDPSLQAALEQMRQPEGGSR